MNNGERIAYVNGEFVPEPEARILIRDKDLVYGDSVFDTARTFDGKLFRLEAHIQRLYESLDLAMIDPQMSKQQMTEATEELVKINSKVLRDGENY